MRVLCIKYEAIERYRMEIRLRTGGQKYTQTENGDISVFSWNINNPERDTVLHNIYLFFFVFYKSIGYRS